MNEPTLFGIVIVPAIVGLVQVAKDTGLPGRFAPLVAVLFGIAAGVAQLEAGSLPWIPAVILGVSFGLTACGLYDGARSLIVKSENTLGTGLIPPKTDLQSGNTNPQDR